MRGGGLSSGWSLCGNGRRKPPLLLLLTLILSLHTYFPAESLANDALMSRIKTAQCALQVSVGRIPGTAMPEEWAASGAKLGFLLEVEFCDDPCASYDMTKERLLLGTASATKNTVRPPAGSMSVPRCG